MFESQNVATARTFVQLFCSGDVNGLESLLARDLEFAGPLLVCGSRHEYMIALRKDPPRAGECEVLSVTSGPDAVAVFYDYVHSGSAVRIGHLFRFRKGLISEMIVLFNRIPEPG